MNPVYDLTMLYLKKTDLSKLSPEELVKTYFEIYKQISDAFDFECHKE